MHEDFEKKENEEEIYEGDEDVRAQSQDKLVEDEDYRKTAQKKRQKLNSGFTTLAEMGTAPKSRMKLDEDRNLSEDEDKPKNEREYPIPQNSRIPMQLFSFASPGAFKFTDKYSKTGKKA